MASSEPPNLLVLAGLLVGNFYYSVAKKSLPVAIPQLQAKLFVSTKDIGDISSAFSISYGVGKVLGGVVSDMAPPYVLYVLGLLLAAFVNLGIVFSTSIPVMSKLWALNAFVQGIGGPALSRLVVDLYPPQERASTWSNLTFACNLGYLLSPAVIRPFCFSSWEGAFTSTGLGSLASAALMSLAYLTVPPKQPPLSHPRTRAESACSHTAASVSEETGQLTKAVPLSAKVGGEEDKGCAGTATDDVDAGRLGTDPAIQTAGSTKAKDSPSSEDQEEHSDSGSRAGGNCSATRQGSAGPGAVVAASREKQEEAQSPPAPAPEQVPASAICITGVMAVKFLLLFAANVLTYFVSKGVQDWTGYYLTEYLLYPRDPTSSAAGTGGVEASLWTALVGSIGWGGGQSISPSAPEMYIWELSLWPEVGGMVGTVLVGRLAAALHDRQSLACFLFTLVCVAGLWSLALHLPQDPASAAAHYMPGADVYSQHYFATDNSSGDSDGSGVGLSSCVHPDQILDLSGGAERLCIDPASMEEHPLEQCQCKSVMLSTIALIFPKAGSSTLALNQMAIVVGDYLLALVKRVFAVNRYFSMRCALFLIGFGINGPKTLVAFEMMSVVPARFCGTVSGVAGLFAQIGAYFAGRFVALTVLQEGWCSYVALLVVGSWAVAALLLLSALL